MLANIYLHEQWGSGTERRRFIPLWQIIGADSTKAFEHNVSDLHVEWPAVRQSVAKNSPPPPMVSVCSDTLGPLRRFYTLLRRFIICNTFRTTGSRWMRLGQVGTWKVHTILVQQLGRKIENIGLTDVDKGTFKFNLWPNDSRVQIPAQFYSVPPGECRIVPWNSATIASLQIHSNSSFTCSPIIRRYKVLVTEKASLNKLK
jgi:hypothetical protein